MADLELTAAQRKRLAREARKLAYEVVEGTAPNFGTGREFDDNNQPLCAVGHVAARAKIAPWTWVMGNPIGRAAYADWLIVTAANDGYRPALPWALLSIADALESTP
jgi:hypothetical protein